MPAPTPDPAQPIPLTPPDHELAALAGAGVLEDLAEGLGLLFRPPLPGAEAVEELRRALAESVDMTAQAALDESALVFSATKALRRLRVASGLPWVPLVAVVGELRRLVDPKSAP